MFILFIFLFILSQHGVYQLDFLVPVCVMGMGVIYIRAKDGISQ